jgi:hypothetical protein
MFGKNTNSDLKYINPILITIMMKYYYLENIRKENTIIYEFTRGILCTVHGEN